MADASTRRDLALAAAHQAAEATAELLRFAREGEGLHSPFEIEVVEKLADALKLALDVAHFPGLLIDDEEERLKSALGAFLEGWV